MVEKTKKPVKVNPTKVNSKPKESKSDLFIRLVKSRAENVLKAMRILGNCSNRSNYEYNQEQIDKIYSTLQESLDNMIYKFTPTKKEQQTFEF